MNQLVASLVISSESWSTVGVSKCFRVFRLLFLLKFLKCSSEVCRIVVFFSVFVSAYSLYKNQFTNDNEKQKACKIMLAASRSPLSIRVPQSANSLLEL